MKMKKPIYMLINCDPDGDSYEIYDNLKEGKESFNEKKKDPPVFGDIIIYLIEVKNPRDFGFGSRGDMCGAEIILEYNSEYPEE